MVVDTVLKKLYVIVSSLGWFDWLGLVVVLFLLLFLAFIVWKRYYRKDDTKLAIPEITVPQQYLLPTDALIKVWSSFIDGIPRQVRPSALRTTFAIVIGDAGSGKTTIIDQYADWKGQDFLFHPSLTDDSLLQLYLGAKALALEFSSALIYDTSTAAYDALKKLWVHLLPQPHIVMVLDSTSLLVPRADQLRDSGQALFGKIKAFSALEKNALPITLALSHMDSLVGFEEFCKFLTENGIPLQIDFPEGDGLNKLESSMEQFQQYLPRALVTQSAQDYVKIVNFLNQIPSLLSVLVDFLHVGGLENELESSPIIRLCLLSEKIHSPGCNPFAPRLISVKQPFVLNYHSKAALILFVIGIFYLSGSYKYQQNLQAEIYQTILLIPKTPIENYAATITDKFDSTYININPRRLLVWRPMQPIFFPKVDYQNKYLFITAVRKYYFFPLLRSVQSDKDAMFKTTRIIGMLYANNWNEIGKIVTKHEQRFPISNKYIALIGDYLNYNTATDELDNILNSMNFSAKGELIEDHSTWLVLFNNFREMLKKPFITPSEFSGIQQQIPPFLEILNRLDYYSERNDIVQWLSQHTNLRQDNSNEIQMESDLQQPGLVQLLNYVSNFQMNEGENCSTNQSLTDCFGVLQTLANIKTTELNDNGMSFTLDGEYFSFTSNQWQDLLKRSRLTMLLRNFISTRNNRQNDGWIFFDYPSVYSDLTMNASNNGQMLFAGQARIDGRLTVDAFENDVKPSISNLATVIDQLPIVDYEKKNFKNFVIKNLNVYSDRYVKSYLNYFRQFKIVINSTWELDYVLDDLQQPDPQLLKVLVDIKNNTKLNFPDGVSFNEFIQKLAVFNVVQRVMEKKDGVYPEFQKYQAMMAQMQFDMSSTTPYVPIKSNDDATYLKGALTPIGRVAWSMLLNEDSSYTRLVKNWLQNEGIQGDWQLPFLAPIKKVKQFGTAEINQNINGIWTDIWTSNVVPLLTKFPFSVTAGPDKELGLDELSSTFSPKHGVFWVTFQQYLSPLSTYSNGIWAIRQELSDSLIMPINYSKRLNAIQQLTSSLWNDQGEPKPFQLLVKPGLLPTFDIKQIPNAPLVSLSYLRQGGDSVLGFNQQANWQKLQLEWWLPKQAEVGIEFRKDEDPTRVYSDLTVSDSTWNLFRLLQKGQSAGALQYHWPLAHPDFPKQPLSLEFIFKTNPFLVFSAVAGS